MSDDSKFRCPEWAAIIATPFFLIGMALYVVIGLPCAGLYLGWKSARDMTMGGP